METMGETRKRKKEEVGDSKRKKISSDTEYET